MNLIELPSQFKGPWDHALIFTYTLNVPFFENALWGQFPPRCRNKIILADGRSFRDECAGYANGELLRFLNHRYIVDGINGPRTAHAKLILLTNFEQGRLLVGSGNLKLQGYASGGELFTRYEYSADSPEHLTAFLSVRELIEGLFEHNYIGPTAVRHIRHLLEGTPWLYQSPVDDWWPVRHNLTNSFLTHIQQAIGDETVEELLILAPFYDENAVALEKMIDTFRPQYVNLLIQPGRTSAKPTALQSVLERFTGHWRILPFSKDSDDPYVHAKLYMLKLRDRALCLQGSPNLSQVAMLLSPPQGNIEVANLLEGPRDTFDSLIESLNIQSEVIQFDALDLVYQTKEIPDEKAGNRWYLTDGEFYDDQMQLNYRGELPELKEASLVVKDHIFPLELCGQGPGYIEVKVPSTAIQLLGRPVPVAIQWGRGGNTSTSNPIFVCNRLALDTTLEVIDESKILTRLGDLDLDDEELEDLLQILDSILLIDRRSIWQLVGHIPPSNNDDEDNVLILDYTDIDYDMLRQHPKLQQYIRTRALTQSHIYSQLQIILDSISTHLYGVLHMPMAVPLNPKLNGKIEEVVDIVEEELEQEEEDKPTRHRVSEQRIRNMLKRFVTRYIRGVYSPDFKELIGFDAMAYNYIIFSHILWLLFRKELVELEFIMHSLLQIWGFVWGDKTQSGYIKELSEAQQSSLLELVRQYHIDAISIAALYYSAYLTRIESKLLEELRLSMRDYFRAMLSNSPFPVSEEVLAESWQIVAELIPYAPPSLHAILDELTKLAHFDTRDNFLRSLEQLHNYPSGSCTFEKLTVNRQTLDKQVSIDCLVMKADNALPDPQTALKITWEWMRFENLDYYRIHAPAKGQRFICELLKPEAIYWQKGQEDIIIVPSDTIYPSPTEWDTALSIMQRVCESAVSLCTKHN